MNDFFTLPKALCDQEIRVKCISKDNDNYDYFEVGKEYDAYYRAPSILGVYSEFDIFCPPHACCHYSYDDFFKHFQVLTVGFESIDKIVS